eukprot:5083206-Pyramimonas_sp.AAC.1
MEAQSVVVCQDPQQYAAAADWYRACGKPLSVTFVIFKPTVSAESQVNVMVEGPAGPRQARAQLVSEGAAPPVR